MEEVRVGKTMPGWVFSIDEFNEKLGLPKDTTVIHASVNFIKGTVTVVGAGLDIDKDQA